VHSPRPSFSLPPGKFSGTSGLFLASSPPPIHQSCVRKFFVLLKLFPLNPEPTVHVFCAPPLEKKPTSMHPIPPGAWPYVSFVFSSSFHRVPLLRVLTQNSTSRFFFFFPLDILGLPRRGVFGHRDLGVTPPFLSTPPSPLALTKTLQRPPFFFTPFS